MTDFEIIQIMLKEYDTLRTEILKRIGHRFAFMGLSGFIGLYAFFSSKDLTFYQIIILMASAFILACIWLQIGNLIARCSKRIAEIENEINQMCGSTLLRWEHEKRGSKIFHMIHK